MRELLKELSALGKTIIISSHILSELAEMCNQVGIIEQGRLLYNGSPQQIKHLPQTLRQLRLRALATAEEVEAALGSYLGITDYRPVNGDWEVNFTGDDTALAGLLAHLVERKIPVIHFSEETSGLEAVFMQITRGEIN
jgi:ABC-2 type transport system ATP-binding protein